MSKQDYGSKLAESLRQARQLDTQPAAPAPATAVTVAPTATKTPATPVRATARPASSQLHPARVWPD